MFNLESDENLSIVLELSCVRQEVEQYLLQPSFVKHQNLVEMRIVLKHDVDFFVLQCIRNHLDDFGYRLLYILACRS